jgi:AcrR family transcriptional regulator
MSSETIEEIEEKISLHKHGKVPKNLRIAQIILTAKKMFADNGYANSSMDELAKRVRVSKPVIYELVGSKDNLFKMILTETGHDLQSRIQNAVNLAATLDAKLRAGGLAFFNFVSEHRMLWLALFVNDQGLFNKEIAQIRKQQSDLVGNLITSSNAFENNSPIYINGIAHALNGAYEALAIWWIDHPDLKPETLADWIVELLLPTELPIVR